MRAKEHGIHDTWLSRCQLSLHPVTQHHHQCTLYAQQVTMHCAPRGVANSSRCYCDTGITVDEGHADLPPLPPAPPPLESSPTIILITIIIMEQQQHLLQQQDCYATAHHCVGAAHRGTRHGRCALPAAAQPERFGVWHGADQSHAASRVEL
jgi:hypothetical protein